MNEGERQRMNQNTWRCSCHDEYPTIVNSCHVKELMRAIDFTPSRWIRSDVDDIAHCTVS